MFAKQVLFSSRSKCWANSTRQYQGFLKTSACFQAKKAQQVTTLFEWRLGNSPSRSLWMMLSMLISPSAMAVTVVQSRKFESGGVWPAANPCLGLFSALQSFGAVQPFLAFFCTHTTRAQQPTVFFSTSIFQPTLAALAAPM